MIGRVIKSLGNVYQVSTEKGILQASLKGKLRLSDSNATNPVAVGDMVEIDKFDEYQIHKILPRKNKITRKAIAKGNSEQVLAANIDFLLIISSLIQPKLHLNFIDRCLITAEAFKIEPVLIFTKTDLVENWKEMADEIHEIYSPLNINTIFSDSRELSDLSKLESLIAGKTSALTGQSGVGKSTLIKTLAPELNIRIGETSKKWSTGKHTTTNAELFEIRPNTFLIDTPGLREFGLLDIEEEELSHYFKEMIPFLGNCKYSKCTHTHEPQCAVKDAVESGKIHVKRYENYLQIFESLDKKSY